MVYNGQIHGADAVILTCREVCFERIPAPSGLVPMFRRSKNGNVHGRLAPFVQSGYIQRWVNVITAIDSEMIVFEK